jgi:hypothetical protein
MERLAVFHVESDRWIGFPSPLFPRQPILERSEGVGGLDHVAHEESFKAQESSMRRAVVGSRRVVVVAGERRIRGTQWAGNGYADAELWSDSRKHSL